MDALALDIMLPEYQEKREDAAERVGRERENRSPSPPPPPAAPSSEDSYEAEVGGRGTFPASDGASPLLVSEESPDGGDARVGAAVPGAAGKSSMSSSSSSCSSMQEAPPTSSFHIPSAMSPSISYDRDHPTQKIVAVFGRLFDGPAEIASNLQRLMMTSVDAGRGGGGGFDVDQPPPQAAAALTTRVAMKFVPFTMKRAALMKGNFTTRELLQYNLVCMCYNASEARILLTGTDGFYTMLLRQTEAILGTNKVAFLITNYNRYRRSLDDKELISPDLRSRLQAQEPLRPYLDGDQVLSWVGAPSEKQLAKLAELAGMENNPNPSSPMNQSCSIL